MARSGRDDLRGITAQAVLPWLCAAAFGPALADADGSAPGPAKMGVLISVGADALAGLLEDVSSRARPASQDPAPDLIRSLEAEISRAVGDVLGAPSQQADELRSDIAMVPALARGVQVPGSAAWPVVSLTVTARPLTDLAAGLAALDGRDPAAVRQRLTDAPGQAHLLIREIIRDAGGGARLVLIIDQFEQVFAADGPDERLERTAFLDALGAAAARPAGPRGEPP